MVLLVTAPPELRPHALSLAEVAQHLLGDIPSPPLLGWLQVGEHDCDCYVCHIQCIGTPCNRTCATCTALVPGATGKGPRLQGGLSI